MFTVHRYATLTVTPEVPSVTCARFGSKSNRYIQHPSRLALTSLLLFNFPQIRALHLKFSENSSSLRGFESIKKSTDAAFLENGPLEDMAITTSKRTILRAHLTRSVKCGF
jgi:hypothetical protein